MDAFYTECLIDSAQTTAFNIAVRENVFDRRVDDGDKIVLVDMQNDAGINYDRQSAGGDMWDDVHPFKTGYEKMANLWYTGLEDILPQAYAGPDQSLNEFELVTLDASGSSDPKNGNLNDTLTYQWVQTAGTPTVVLSPDAQAEKPTFRAPGVSSSSETLTFTLTVTDDDELVSTDTVDIDVQAILPQANAGGDQDVAEGATVTLDGTGSTGRNITYAWTPESGTGWTLSDPTAPAPTFTAPSITTAGGTLPLTFQLTVTDDLTATSSDTVVVNVADLQAVAGEDQTAAPGATVTLDGSASTPTTGLTYAWTQTGGTTVQLADIDTATPTFTAPRAADISAAVLDTLTFQLTVTDSSGLITSSDTTRVTIDDGTVPSTGDGGGGGGGGCFISTVANGSQMAGNISLAAPRAEHAATLAIVITMVAFIISCVAITLRKPRKRWQKL